MVALMYNATSTANLFSNLPALPQGYKLMGFGMFPAAAQYRAYSMHMLLLSFAIATAMLLYWHVLLPLLRVFVLLLLSCCAAVLELLAARPKVKRRDLQTGKNLWGGGCRSSYLACGAVGVRRSPAENAEATDPPPKATQVLDFCSEI